MRIRRSTPSALVAVAVCAATLAACSSSDAGADFTATKDQPLVISLDDFLAKTGGTAAVGIADPQHGTITRRVDGSVVYTPAAGYTGSDSITVTTTDAVKLYTTDIKPLGDFGGVTVQGSGFGSAFAPVPGSKDEFYGLTDRGPNVDGKGKNEKIVAVPDFTPSIAKFKMVGTRAVVESTIPLKNPVGQPFNGLVDTSATTGETIKDLAGKVLPPTDHGIDSEGLVALPDGSFWVSDEYGPFLVHFDAKGNELERLAPGRGLPKELSLRTANQGMEGLTVTPDGNTLVGIVQSALKEPGVASAREVPMTRIVTVDLKTRAVKEFIYPLENPKKKLAVSEITALSATTFVVDERDGNKAPKADKKLWTIDIGNATDVGPRSEVAGAQYDPDRGLLIDGKPIEVYVGTVSTADGVAALRKAGITAVAKKSSLDLGGLVDGLNADGKFFGHDKIEGVATTDGGKTLYISNDSDFGLDGSTGDAPPFGLAAKTLPNGVQDSGEVLMVDTTKLPAKTQTKTINLTVK
ncbi:esterase-like activity of phytase family protein [Nocardia sp. NBC_01503]|uniref:esterase-like activity of phytase family protein n=1 Tax=Nocardia sp. NBC_01503 TaxID=2975997 RepID=UPI002E7B6F1B|nr:esterase-like activity of phytase family protein [Nocardia sp. NBC_01503]WTL29753.1 esterase-like activity of phytase family protein [Nocardia sp. NBC_01503]